MVIVVENTRRPPLRTGFLLRLGLSQTTNQSAPASVALALKRLKAIRLHVQQGGSIAASH